MKVDKIGGYSNKYVYINDYDLVYRLSTKYEIHNHQSVLSQNRLHKDSLTYLDNKIMQKELYNFLKKISSSSPNLLTKIKNINSRLKCHYRILRSKNIMRNDISILIPVYNSEKYLESAINSIINQTHKKWKIIVITMVLLIILHKY